MSTKIKPDYQPSQRVYELLTQQILKDQFSYSDNGELIRKKNKTHAGWIENHGYKRMSVNGRTYLTHRLIFLYHHGYLPEFIDHLDRDKENNKIENLRECTHSQNMLNTGDQKNNTSGFKNISKHSQSGKWVATFTINKKVNYVGIFEERADAVFALNETRT